MRAALVVVTHSMLVAVLDCMASILVQSFLCCCWRCSQMARCCLTTLCYHPGVCFCLHGHIAVVPNRAVLHRLALKPCVCFCPPFNWYCCSVNAYCPHCCCCSLCAHMATLQAGLCCIAWRMKQLQPKSRQQQQQQQVGPVSIVCSCCRA